MTSQPCAATLRAVARALRRVQSPDHVSTAAMLALAVEMEAEQTQDPAHHTDGRVVPNPCSICGKPILGGSFFGTGDGSMRNGGSFAHYDCYKSLTPSPGAAGEREEVRGTIVGVKDGCTWPRCSCPHLHHAPGHEVIACKLISDRPTAEAGGLGGEKCPRCGGSGTVAKHWPVHNEPDEQPCPECEGTGEVKTCATCGCQELDHRGLLTCRCPAPPPPAPSPPTSPAGEELLPPDWRASHCEIIPGYMPPFPGAHTKPACVVRFRCDRGVPTGSGLYLRYSKGPETGTFWDIYPDDFLNEDLAREELAKAPVPQGFRPSPSSGESGLVKEWREHRYKNDELGLVPTDQDCIGDRMAARIQGLEGSLEILTHQHSYLWDEYRSAVDRTVSAERRLSEVEKGRDALVEGTINLNRRLAAAEQEREKMRAVVMAARAVCEDLRLWPIIDQSAGQRYEDHRNAKVLAGALSSLPRPSGDAK